MRDMHNTLCLSCDLMHGITDLIREATGGGRPGKGGKLTEFAAAIGTTPTTVSRWRDGVIPGPQWRAALARYFDTTEDDIDLASQVVGVSLDDLAVKLNEILSELREHRALSEQPGDAALLAVLQKKLDALSRRVSKLDPPRSSPAA